MNSSLDFYGMTDRGRVRERNEDTFFADGDSDLFIVADGMGGQAAGAEAAEIVVKVLPSLLRQRLDEADRSSRAVDTRRILHEVLIELNRALHRHSAGRPELWGMGAATVVALIREGQAWIGHLGDCRAYRFRNPTLERLTTDHTLVQLLVETGALKPEEAATHPSRSRLTRSVGMPGEALPDTCATELRPGDKLLLCSDGLTGMVSDAGLTALLKLPQPAHSICEQLVAAANEAGGRDNITALVIAVPGR